MRATISEKAKKYFQPFFVTHVNGLQKQLTLKEVTNNWHQYVNTPVGHTLYSNHEELSKFLAQRGVARSVVRLDMRKATRGSAFSRKQEVELYLKKQAKARQRLVARNKKNKDAIKAHKAKLTREANKEQGLKAPKDNKKDAGTADQTTKK